MSVPLPQIEANILALSNSKYFSSLDLANAYFHLKIKESSQKYLYMNGPHSYVLFIYMPFGVQAASQFFTLWVRGLYDQLPKKLQNYILFYLDDILIHSPDLKSHFEAMKQLFAILEKKSCCVAN